MGKDLATYPGKTIAKKIHGQSLAYGKRWLEWQETTGMVNERVDC